ncbi:MAG: hypothetical protein LBC81_00340 [Tannerellaceae bacterium]|jgi:hypothetical protein|nr:hypothetical protein [Tannerellaceae bacterium]
MSQIVAFYYSQTGQGLDILRSVCRPLADAGHEIVYREIIPEEAFPYPWSADAFFDAFPESRQGIGCTTVVSGLSDVPDPALVIIAWPAWFLSPAIPVHGFFANEAVRGYLRGKDVVSICGCRNMWIKAQEGVNAYMDSCGARRRGVIILQDRHHNLVSVITIIRWLIGGRRERRGLFPDAGVSRRDIEGAAVFGGIIAGALGEYDNLQSRLLGAGAVRYKPDIAFVEKIGHSIFGIWSEWILRKGKAGDARRAFRLKLFKYYLFTVLFLVSPVGLLAFYATYPFRIRGIRRERRRLRFDD